MNQGGEGHGAAISSREGIDDAVAADHTLDLSLVHGRSGSKWTPPVTSRTRQLLLELVKEGGAMMSMLSGSEAGMDVADAISAGPSPLSAALRLSLIKDGGALIKRRGSNSSRGSSTMAGTGAPSSARGTPRAPANELKMAAAGRLYTAEGGVSQFWGAIFGSQVTLEFKTLN
jgi:hypothetical protein